MARKKRSNGDQPIGVGLTTKQMKRKKPLNTHYLTEVNPLTDHQTQLFDSYSAGKHIIAYGVAGTGKTFVTLYNALKDVLSDDTPYETIYLVRSLVSTREIGFLPGDLQRKVDPYLRPLYDALYDLFGFEQIQRKIDNGSIEIAPLAFMRGRTLKNSFAILDEAQNATLTQIKMFLTRIGENSKLVVNGDPSQIDLINKSHSGLIKSKKILKDIKEIKVVEFDHKDVVRHPLVSKIIQAYQKNFDDQN